MDPVHVQLLGFRGGDGGGSFTLDGRAREFDCYAWIEFWINKIFGIGQLLGDSIECSAGTFEEGLVVQINCSLPRLLPIVRNASSGDCALEHEEQVPRIPCGIPERRLRRRLENILSPGWT